MAQRDRPKASDPEAESGPDLVEPISAEPIELQQPVAETPTPEPLQEDPLPTGITPPPRQKSVFLPAVGGGIVAAAIGFGLSHFNLLGLTAPSGDLSAVQSRLETVEAGLGQVTSDVAQVREASASPDPGLSDRISALESAAQTQNDDPRMADLLTRMDALDARLSEAAAAGGGVDGAALSALQAQVRELQSAAPAASEDLSALVAETRASLAEAEAKAEALTTNAEAIARQATLTAALGQLRVALDTGQPFAATLGTLEGVDVPPALSSYAETGLPSLAALKQTFPVAARAALDAARRANAGEGWTDRLGTFLQSQTGARSVTPRTGDDPDAILSRAEAALSASDLETALQEIATLPEESKAAMAEWTENAERRRAAAAAIETLAAGSGG